jgi:hypothetical protein
MVRRFILVFAFIMPAIPFAVDALPYGSGNYGTCTFDTCSISISTSGSIDLSATVSPSDVYTIAGDSVTISTGADTGYTLTLASSGAGTSLTSGGDTVAASGGSPASPTVLAANTWGYRIDGLSGFGAGPTTPVSNAPSSSLTFAGVPANGSPQTIRTTSDVAAAEITNVWYGLRANLSLPPGTYTGSITYTAVTNP